MDVKEIIALIGVTAAAFKAITSGLRDLQEIKTERAKQKKRRSPTKKKRRK